MPSQLAGPGQARTVPQTQLGVHLLDSHRGDLRDTGREHGLYTFASVAVNLSRRQRRGFEDCFGDWGWEKGSDALREGRRGRHRVPAPAWEWGTQSRPAPSRVFILYLLGTGEEEPRVGGAAPPCFPAWPLYLLFTFSVPL